VRRIREICNSGATVLFVSHGTALISELCNRAVWIDHGRVLLVGQADAVCKAYEKSVWDRQEAENIAATKRASESLVHTARTGRYALGGDNIRIVSVTTVTAEGRPAGGIVVGAPLIIRIDWEGETEDPEIYSSFRIDTDRITAVAGFEAYERHAFLNAGKSVKGQGSIYYTIPQCELGPGDYYISASICRHMLPKGAEAILHYIEKACKFSVSRRSLWNFTYLYDPEIQWRFEDRAHGQ
jgi:lipopolysaccharide transport system ATP-binding protein